MSKIEVDTIAPQSGTTVTLGESGDTIQVASGATNNLGITEADQWRLTADLTADASPISSNWERVDELSFSKIGTGMSVSSGYWTFPSTGLYLVSIIGQITSVSDSLNYKILVTQNNSSYDETAYAINNSGTVNTRINVSTHTFVNVTDTSNVKVRLDLTGNDGDGVLHGNSDKTETGVSFIRLGDSQ